MIELPGWLGMWNAGLLVGLLSGLLGVGGSAFTVPFLTHHGVNIRSAVVVSVAIAMTASIIGAITFMITGLHAQGLPHWSTGYVYWPACFGIVLGGMSAVSWGARLSHQIDEHRLKRYFAIFLVVVGLHMLIPL